MASLVRHRLHSMSRNEANVVEWMRQKQELEVMLAWDLLETFNKVPRLINTLRAMAGMAVQEMMDLSTFSTGRTAVAAAIDAEKAIMALLKRKKVLVPYTKETPAILLDKSVGSPAELGNIFDDIDTLDAQECSDIVRLYGTAVEKCAEPLYQDFARQKDSYRVELEDSNYIWNQERSRTEGRHRWSKYKDADKAEYAKIMAKLAPGKVQTFLNSQNGGQSGFALADSSTIGKIDRVYGLVPAADISGTTTDTVFFLDRFGTNLPGVFDPIFYLLPVATIVAGAHHSLIEVASALTVNDVCEYHIGFYSSLLPDRKDQTEHAGVAEVTAALRAAESDARNRHMQVFYRSSGALGVDGCLLFEGTDATFRSQSSVRTAIPAARHWKPWPTAKDVIDMWPATEISEQTEAGPVVLTIR